MIVLFNSQHSPSFLYDCCYLCNKVPTLMANRTAIYFQSLLESREPKVVRFKYIIMRALTDYANCFALNRMVVLTVLVFRFC